MGASIDATRSSSAKKLAIELSVGWSKRSVAATSRLSRAERLVTNAAAARESRPADMSAAPMSMLVPRVSRATAATIDPVSSVVRVATDSLSPDGRESSHDVA